MVGKKQQSESTEEYISRIEEENTELLKCLENYSTPQTGRMMCELISKYLSESKGIEQSPEEIWNSNPDGELFFIFDLHTEACNFFARKIIAKATGGAA